MTTKNKKDNHLDMLEDNYSKAADTLSKKSTVANTNNFTAAKEALDLYLESKKTGKELRIKGKPKILEYLNNEGYEIKKTKLYDDIKAKKIPSQSGGHYLITDIERYAKAEELIKYGEESTSIGNVEQKSKWEQKVLEEKHKALQRNNDITEGKLVLSSEVEQLHTAKLALLIGEYENFIHGAGLEAIISIVGGDPKKLPKLKKHIEKELIGSLKKYAKSPQFTIPTKSMLQAEKFKGGIDND